MVNESVKVGKYFLTYVKKLKEGGYGVIWKVRDPQGHEYALKKISIQSEHMKRVAMAEINILVSNLLWFNSFFREKFHHTKTSFDFMTRKS